MADMTFVVHSDWLDSIKNLSVEEQDQIIGDLVRYGCRIDTAHNDNPYVESYVNLLKGRIDYSINKYQGKIKNTGKTGKKVSDEEIWQYFQEHKCRSQDIADFFGVSKSTIDHSEGWKQRDNESFASL